MPPSTLSLSLSKILPCRPAEAFRAWTVPELFQQWFIPASGVRATATMDVRPGGKYQISFQLPEGKPPMVVGGEFLVVDAPHYLEYTWNWADPDQPGILQNTVVKITFRELGDERTELVLTHEGFANSEDRADHTSGWTSILEQMALALGAGQKPA